MKLYRFLIHFLICIFLINTAKANQLGKGIRVMTWNIQIGLGKYYIPFWRGHHDIPSVEEIKDNLFKISQHIKKHDPDIVVLQEVTKHSFTPYSFLPSFVPNFSINLMDFLKEKLSQYKSADVEYWRSNWPLCCGAMSGPMDYSLVVFSKKTITAYNIIKLKPLPLPLCSYYQCIPCVFPKRKIFGVKIDYDSTSLIVVTTHFESLDDDGETRKEQFQTLTSYLNKLGRSNLPWIMGGDLNMVPPGTSLKIRAEKRFPLDLVEIGENCIFPGPKIDGQEQPLTAHEHQYSEQSVEPEMTLDYIMANGEYFKIKHSFVDTSTALSDHYPVIVDFEVIKSFTE